MSKFAGQSQPCLASSKLSTCWRRPGSHRRLTARTAASKPPKVKTLRDALQLLLASTGMVICAPTTATAASFGVSPSAISDQYTGYITFSIGGLSSAGGETVLVEKFFDANANGVIDAGEPLVQSFRLTDGQ